MSRHFGQQYTEEKEERVAGPLGIRSEFCGGAGPDGPAQKP